MCPRSPERAGGSWRKCFPQHVTDSTSDSLLIHRVKWTEALSFSCGRRARSQSQDQEVGISQVHIMVLSKGVGLHLAFGVQDPRSPGLRLLGKGHPRTVSIRHPVHRSVVRRLEGEFSDSVFGSLQEIRHDGTTRVTLEPCQDSVDVQDIWGASFYRSRFDLSIPFGLLQEPPSEPAVLKHSKPLLE